MWSEEWLGKKLVSVNATGSGSWGGTLAYFKGGGGEWLRS